ncbi:hypothetical protein DYB32_008872, partial [Aphanomyces invadans]
VRYSRVTGGPIKWTLKSDDTTMQIYKGDDPDAPPGVVSWLGVAEVMATIDEVVALFRTDTSEEYHEYCSMFMKDTQHDFELDGKHGWTRAFKSVNLSCCPDLQNSLGLVRGIHHRSGYCFLQSSRPGYLQVSQLIQADLRGKMADVLVDVGMKRRCRIIKGMDMFLRQKRLSQGTFLHEAELVPKESRSKCFVCQRKFGAFSKKGQCRKCGEVVCRRCSQMWDIRIAGNVIKRRVCTACSCDNMEPPTDANTIVDDPNDDQADSQPNETPRTQSRYPLPTMWTNHAPGVSPPLSPSAKEAMGRQLSGLTIADDSTQSTSSNGGKSLQMLKPLHIGLSPFGGGPTTPQQRQQHRLPPASNVITLRKDDMFTAMPMQLHLPEPPQHNPRGAESTCDDDQQSVFKDDMSNYSESLVSFHQGNYVKRAGPVSMMHPNATPQNHQQQYRPQSTYDNPYDPPPLQSFPPERMGHHMPRRAYDLRRNAAARVPPREPTYVNPYVSMQQQQFVQYDAGAYMPAQPNQRQQPPPHSNHDQFPSLPPYQRPYDSRRRHPPAARQPFPSPYQHPEASYGQYPQDGPKRGIPTLDHSQYGYIQRQHQYLQDTDGDSSIFSHDDGNPSTNHFDQRPHDSNPYSTLYTYHPREVPPPPAPRRAHKAIDGHHNDMISARPPASASPSVALETGFNQHD